METGPTPSVLLSLVWLYEMGQEVVVWEQCREVGAVYSSPRKYLLNISWNNKLISAFF
jgi:hypothetical protein